MIRNKLLPAILPLAAAVALAAPAAAFPAFTSSKILNLRAGPGVEFPIVGVMERNVRVDMTGCIEDFTWCVVTVDGLVGWVFARSIVVDTTEGIFHLYELAEQGRVPVVGADGVLVVVE